MEQLGKEFGQSKVSKPFETPTNTKLIKTSPGRNRVLTEGDGDLQGVTGSLHLVCYHFLYHGTHTQ